MGMRIALTVILLGLLGSCVNTKLEHLQHERFHQKERDLDALAHPSRVPTGPLTLPEIIEIAMANNLDLRVKEREYAIQNERATGERLKTLPSLSFNAEHSYRNENTASFSVNAQTGEVSAGVDPVTGQPLSPGSIGSSQWVNRWDLTAAYNIVDFGLSYLRARQEINRAVSSSFQYQRAKQNLILDVYKAYWKAIAAQKVVIPTLQIRKTSRILQSNIEGKIQAKLIPNMTGLKSELQLVNIRNRLAPIEKKYQEAILELRALMGLPPSVDIELADYEIEDDPMTIELEELEKMEAQALQNRPELYSTDAEHKIFRDEVRAAFVEMLPNTSLFIGRNYDADPFLIHHSWTLSGVRTAWNLLALPQRWYRKREARERVKLSEESRLALSLGVITQVNLAYYTFEDARAKFRNAREGEDLNSRMLYIATKQREFGAFDGVDMINFDADALESLHLLYEAYGEVQTSLELINNAMGVPFYFKGLPYQMEEKETDTVCAISEECE